MNSIPQAPCCRNPPATKEDTISIIIPVYNCKDFIRECLESIYSQVLKPELKIEISIYDDGSCDGSSQLLQDSLANFFLKESSQAFSMVISRNDSGTCKGVGYARNRAIEQSSGTFLCFCDADDVMHPNRVLIQYKYALADPNAIVGSRFKRIPENSTENFTYWANNLNEIELKTQIYQSFGPTLVMPTWFCSRSVFENIPGGFDEGGRGTPEDLIFFYKHLDFGGNLIRAPEVLMSYRYHTSATTFSITDETILSLRINRLESVVLSQFDYGFTIWNAGKSGRRFFRSLKEINQKKVQAFCDIDVKKLQQKYYEPHPLNFRLPIVHPNNAQPPFIICVKTELIWDKDGPFRKLLDNMNLNEGSDYYYFN